MFSFLQKKKERIPVLFKFFRKFSNGRTHIHDEAEIGRPSVLDDLQEQMKYAIREDRRVTVRDFVEKFQILKFSLNRII